MTSRPWVEGGINDFVTLVQISNNVWRHLWTAPYEKQSNCIYNCEYLILVAVLGFYLYLHVLFCTCWQFLYSPMLIKETGFVLLYLRSGCLKYISTNWILKSRWNNHDVHAKIELRVRWKCRAWMFISVARFELATFR